MTESIRDSESSYSSKFSMRSRIHSSVSNDLTDDPDYQLIRRNRLSNKSNNSSVNVSTNSNGSTNSNDYFDDQYHKLKNTPIKQPSNLHLEAFELARKDLIRAESFKALKSYRKSSFSCS